MKKPLRLIAALCAGMFAFSGLPAAPAEALSQNINDDDYSYFAADHYAPMWGDVTMDNAVYRSDLIALQQIVDCTYWNPWFTPSINADVDGSGSVDENDVAVLKRWIAARAEGKDPDAECAAERAAWRKHYVFPHECTMGEEYSIPEDALGYHQGLLTFTVVATEDTELTYSMRIPTTDENGAVIWKNLTEKTDDYWENWLVSDADCPHPHVSLKAGVPYTISIDIEHLYKAWDMYYTFRILEWDNPDASVFLTDANIIELAADGSPYNFSFLKNQDACIMARPEEDFCVPVLLGDPLRYSKLRFTVRYPEFAEYEDSYFCEGVSDQEITVQHDKNARTLTYTMNARIPATTYGSIIQMRFCAKPWVPERCMSQSFEYISLDAYTAAGDHYRCTGHAARFILTGEPEDEVHTLVTTGHTLPNTTVTTTTVTFPEQTSVSAQNTTTTAETTTTTTAETTTRTTTRTTTDTTGTTGTTAPLFVWGEDNWNFDNNSIAFKVQKYFVDQKIREEFARLYPMEPVGRKLLMETVDYNNTRADWSGSCFGMTLTQILVRQNMLDLTLFGGEKIVNQNSNTPEMLSLINLFQAAQGTNFSQTIRQCALLSGPDTVKQDKYIKRLAETLKQGKLVKVGTTKRITQFLLPEDDARRTMWSNHAVLAYGIEDCDYDSEFTKTHYDKRILIADPNRLRQNTLYDKACIYYNSEDQSWIIPEYCNETKSVRHACCWNSGTDYGENGFINNLMTFESPTEANSLMSAFDVPNYIAGAEFQGSDPMNAVMGVVLSSGNPALDYDADEEDNIILCGMEYDETEERPVSMSYALVNPTSRYYLAYADKYSDYNVRMDYENAAYFAKAGNAKYMEFAPEGDISFTGSDTDYDVTLVTNPSLCTTDWYSLRVLGAHADSMRLVRHEDGYVFRADSMQNITVSAENDTHRAAVTFSVPQPCNVLIYEIDEDTIGIKADTDDDGSFETVLNSEKTSLRAGDLNCDGTLSAADAVLLARVVAEDSDVTVTENGLRNAEVDGDSQLTVSDVLSLLQVLSYINSSK